MWKWIWPKVGSNPVSQNTDSEMFDRSDYPYTETFVREAIQNTLDAILDKSRPAVISFRFHKGPVSAVKSLIGAAIDLRAQARLPVPDEWKAGRPTGSRSRISTPKASTVICRIVLAISGTTGSTSGSRTRTDMAGVDAASGA